MRRVYLALYDPHEDKRISLKSSGRGDDFVEVVVPVAQDHPRFADAEETLLSNNREPEGHEPINSSSASRTYGSSGCSGQNGYSSYAPFFTLALSKLAPKETFDA